MKISEAFTAHEHGRIIIRNYSIRAIETYRRVERTLTEVVGDKEIAELTIEDVYNWDKQISRARKPNTVRNDISCLRQVLKWLSIQGVACLNFELIPTPKRQETIPVFLTPEEVTRMIDHATSLRNKFAVSLLYSSGIRVAEFISLDRGQIRNRSFTVVGKGKKTRLCFIDERTDKLMGEYLATRQDNSPALVISNILKDRLTRGTVELLVKNTARRAGLAQHVTPHSLRHSFASDFTRNNGGARHLQKLLGHKSLATTMIYSHVADNELYEKYEQFHSV